MVNLSLANAVAVGRFYSPIHTTMRDVAATRTLPPTTSEFKAWIDRALPRRGPRGAALDAGCGVHTFNSRILHDAGFSVVSVDLNDEAVAAAARAGMRAAHASVTALPFASGSFQFVVCTGVAHHTPDPMGVFREIHRVLAPGGAAYLSLYCFEASPFDWSVRTLRLIGRVVPFSLAHRIGRVSPAINNFVLDHMYVPVLWLFKAAELERAFRAIGFEVRDNFVSAVDPFHPRVGRAISGDGLLRVFALQKPRVS
jgi:SAM-dependent methyltransferase